jgi:L-threonylcarbamoyladenylate synthase
MERFFPGPLSLILPRQASVPDIVTAGLNTVAVRMPAHPVARQFLEACGRPVAAPSANRSGRPSPTSWEAVKADLEGRIPCILKGERSPIGIESSVVDCTAQPPILLRSGAVSLEELRDVVPEIEISSGAAGQLARSPGMRHRHYAPRARVTLVDTPPATPPLNAAFIGMVAPSPGFRLVAVCDSLEAYAHQVFDFFRRCDAAGVTLVLCQRVSERGIGRALMDRIQKAAEAGDEA